MKIAEHLIKTKAKAGRTSKGSNVMYVETHGGLHAFFIKNENKWEALGAAQHKAIASFFAEKKADSENMGKIEWEKDFIAKSVQEENDLKKSEDSEFEKSRSKFFYPSDLNKNSSDYLIYDISEKEIDVMDKENVEYGLKNSLFGKDVLIRNESNQQVYWLNSHPDFNLNKSEPDTAAKNTINEPTSKTIDAVLSMGIIETFKKAEKTEDQGLIKAIKERAKKYLDSKKVLRK